MQEKNHFAKGCKGKVTAVYTIESDEAQEEISVVRVQAMKDKAFFAEMLSSRNLSDFKLTLELALTFYHTSMWEMWILLLVPSPLLCGMAPWSSLW